MSYAPNNGQSRVDRYVLACQSLTPRELTAVIEHVRAERIHTA